MGGYTASFVLRSRSILRLALAGWLLIDHHERP